MSINVISKVLCGQESFILSNDERYLIDLEVIIRMCNDYENYDINTINMLLRNIPDIQDSLQWIRTFRDIDYRTYAQYIYTACICCQRHICYPDDYITVKNYVMAHVIFSNVPIYDNYMTSVMEECVVKKLKRRSY